jgi:hypothetical protein
MGKYFVGKIAMGNLAWEICYGKILFWKNKIRWTYYAHILNSSKSQKITFL